MAVLGVLLDHRADVAAATTAAGITALHLAAGFGHLATTHLLLDAGADVQVEDDSGRTPLYYAAANRHAATVNLLQTAVRANAVQHDGLFPLHAAAQQGNSAMVQELLSQGAHINAVASKALDLEVSTPPLDSSTAPTGHTTLHLAAGLGHAMIAQLLVDAGADVEATDSLGRTALYYAAVNGHADTVAVLLSAGSMNTAQPGSLPPLHAAAKGGHTAVLQVLLDYGADVDAATDSTEEPVGTPAGATALHNAAVNGHTAAIQLLVDAGADVQATESSGCTPLYLAAMNGYADTTAELLSAGACVNTARQDGFTPLHAAAEWGHPAVLRVLLDDGAAVDVSSATGETPLLLAAQQGRLAVVDLLLLAGADPNVADNSGLRPLQVAVENQDVTLVRRLLQANADCNAPTAPLDMGDSLLAVAAAYDSVAVVEALLAAGARSSSIDEFGHDALQAAVDMDEHAEPQLDMVVALLSCEHAAPSVDATRAALVSTMQTGLYDISARLLLHLHQAAQQEGFSQENVVAPVYDAEPVQDRSRDERARTSLALLHAWTVDAAGTAATHRVGRAGAGGCCCQARRTRAVGADRSITGCSSGGAVGMLGGKKAYPVRPMSKGLWRHICRLSASAAATAEDARDGYMVHSGMR
jgi:ankyrin repeat protein